MSAKSVSLCRAPRPAHSRRQRIREPERDSVEDVLPTTADPDSVAGDQHQPGACQYLCLSTGAGMAHDHAVVETQAEHQPLLFVGSDVDGLVTLDGDAPRANCRDVRADALAMPVAHGDVL